MKTIFKLVVLALVIYISYQAGYRNGSSNNPTTVKTIKESVTTTVGDNVKIFEDAFNDTTDKLK